MPLGSFLGALCSSFLADKYSRKTAIQVASIFWIVGSALQAAADGIPILVIGRFVAGICVGIASSIVPVYQAEIAPKEIRGRVVSLQQWAITWGILIQYFIQVGASFTGGGPDNPEQGSAAFRIPWGVQIVPGAILFVGMTFFPKSPRWLATKDRWEEAIMVLANLHGNGDVNHPKVLAEYQEIEEALRFEREEAKSDFKALMEPRIFKRVILGMSIQMWSQLSGMNVMMYYIVYIMETTGTGSPVLQASIQYVLNVLLTLPAILYLDKWGRRPSLLLGSFGMMSLLLIVGALEALYGEPYYTSKGPLSALSWKLQDGHDDAGKAIIALSYLFVCTFAVTWGPTSWTYPSEIFPTQVRAKAVSLATASNWLWNCALAFAVPPLLWYINWRMYVVFAAFNGAAFVHMFLTAPETKGKTLEEMNDVFDSGRPAWKGVPKGSRLDALQQEIADGNLKVAGPTFTSLEKEEPRFSHSERSADSV
ncbi:MFS sugar transporter [Thelotrema lepadinum]|nr:MFS sugar transporter [Thelotrema lepadinum]